MEWSSLPITQGSRNGQFGRRSDPRSCSDLKNEEPRDSGKVAAHQTGFFIDEPTQLLTALASGIVVVKARNADREHLDFIDGRKGG